jgi:phage terminase large subunit-like protein
VATARPAAKPSIQPRLSEAARHVVWPSGIVSTDWPVIEARLALMGVSFDLWQVGIGQLAFAKRDDDKYACTIGGVSLSIPRQVGKTFAVGMMIIAFCLEYPGSTVLWTAHRTRTSTKTFQSMQGLVKGKRIKPHLAQTRSDGVRATNGEQQIEFRNGSVIMFGAREGGFGRGFDEVDVEVFDEAQILTEKALEDMVAATNQSRHPHGALLFFMGTPPRPDVDPGEEFASRREEALSGDAEDMVYVEFSADENCEPNDREQWAKANPSFPGRTPLESMLRMRKNLRNVDSWRREALGIWPNDGDLASAWLVEAVC